MICFTRIYETHPYFNNIIPLCYFTITIRFVTKQVTWHKFQTKASFIFRSSMSLEFFQQVLVNQILPDFLHRNLQDDYNSVLVIKTIELYNKRSSQCPGSVWYIYHVFLFNIEDRRKWFFNVYFCKPTKNDNLATPQIKKLWLQNYTCSSRSCFGINWKRVIFIKKFC